MTLELSELARRVQVMGTELAAREQRYAELVVLARTWLARYSDAGARLRKPALSLRVAIPAGEPLGGVYPLQPIPEQMTFIAADGTQIQPDRHGAVLYYLINIGSLVYRHGSGLAPEPHSQPKLGYTEDDLYEHGLLVSGNLLDVRRDLAELIRLADLCIDECSISADSTMGARLNRTIAVVDGTLTIWMMEHLSLDSRQKMINDYLFQLSRIRDVGANVAAFTSRPRSREVVSLLHLAYAGSDANRSMKEPNPLGHLPDRAVFESLPAGARSALFISPLPINREHYQKAGHAIYFFYVNLAEEEREPVIARVEVPVWVATDANRLRLVHAAIVSQARITGDYPYALARADELAFVSGPERRAFEEMVATALSHAGFTPAISPKGYYKTLTRGGRRKHAV